MEAITIGSLSKRVFYVIDEQYVSEVSIDDSEIFDVEAFFTPPATVSEVPMRNAAFLVKVINDDIGIALMTSCEDYELVFFS